MEREVRTKNCILIVDDDFINREILKNTLSDYHTFREACDGKEGLEQLMLHMDELCAVILDVRMPALTGIEVLRRLEGSGITEKIPFFLITAQDDGDVVNEAYSLGVVDVVSKPITPIVIQKRVKTVIELFSAREALSEQLKGQEKKLSESEKAIDNMNRGMIEALATAIEFRDIESGQHVSRIYGITKYILTNTEFGEGLSAETIESIARGSIMHDVGKIAISDVILNKPGKLTREEFDIMKLHTVKGSELLLKICRTQTHESYRYAAEIARHHHERYDGRGYPDGIAGDEISIPAQVTSIADVYDALVSERTYKKAYSPEDAVRMIVNGECGSFNPKLLKCFLEAEPVIRSWYLNDDDAFLYPLATDDHEENDINGGSAQVSEDANKVNDLMLLMTAVETAFDMIISANLTKNTYYMIDYARFKTHCAPSVGVFDELIEAGASSIPVSHRKEFHDTFCRESLLRAYKDGKKSVRLEHPQYSDDGKLHWLETKVLFMEDLRTGDLLQITLSSYIDRDVEEREKTRKILNDALDLAERANSAKHDFLSKMSHNIRTPLNAIIGMTTIIASDLEDKKRTLDCLDKIATSSKSLLGIINDVLDYSKIENGGISLHLADFSLRDMITDVSTDAGERADNKSQMLRLSIGEMVGDRYIGDEYRIRQIIENLLDNAYSYTPNGGTYTFTVDVSRISDKYDVLIFKVEDTGCGICPETLNYIFEPFAQSSGTEKADSIGLGLPISRNLAHLMNGDISVTSEVGVGSTFIFELPLERSSSEAKPEDIDQELRVLVVDDDTDVCEHTSAILHKIGISAENIDNGDDAIGLVKKNLGTADEFDVAIVDWQIAGGDCIKTVRALRGIAGDGLLVIIMSEGDWSDFEDEARAAGVDFFLAKPISEGNLRTAVACSGKIVRAQRNISFNGECVLVAEDNEFNAEVAKAILEMKGLSVDIAPDGKCAYDMFTRSKDGDYIAILMDVTMPVMDGHEATRAIRASEHPQAGSIPIYAITANAFHNDILEAKLAGMNAHLAKPIDFDEVAKLLYKIVKSGQTEKNKHGEAI